MAGTQKENAMWLALIRKANICYFLRANKLPTGGIYRVCGPSMHPVSIQFQSNHCMNDKLYKSIMAIQGLLLKCKFFFTIKWHDFVFRILKNKREKQTLSLWIYSGKLVKAVWFGRSFWTHALVRASGAVQGYELISMKSSTMKLLGLSNALYYKVLLMTTRMVKGKLSHTHR